MLRLAAFVVLSFAALGVCEEEPAADKPQGDLQGDWYDQGLCRQVSCANGFRCVPQGYNAPSIGIGGNGRVMCIRWDTSCRDLVDNGMDYGMGPGNQYPGMGPGAGNQCNSDADCYRLSNAGNNIGNGMGYDRASMGISCCNVRGQNYGTWRRRCIFHPRYIPSSINNGMGK